MEDIFQRLVELNKEITYKFGTEAYDIRCKLYDIIQDGRKKVNNGVLGDVSVLFSRQQMIDFADAHNTDYDITEEELNNWLNKR